MAQERFRAGRLTTGYIAEEFPEGFAGVALDEAALRRLAALACCSAYALETRAVTGEKLSASNGAAKTRAVLIGEGTAARRWDFASTPTASSSGSPSPMAQSSSSRPAGSPA